MWIISGLPTIRPDPRDTTSAYGRLPSVRDVFEYARTRVKTDQADEINVEVLAYVANRSRPVAFMFRPLDSSIAALLVSVLHKAHLINRETPQPRLRPL